MSNFPRFRHVLVIEDQKARRIISLEEQVYSLGRESTNEIVIYDRSISRQHATLMKIKKTPNGDNYCYRIIDGDREGNRSTNGITINGNNRVSHDLKHGDVIIFGGKAKASYYILDGSIELALFQNSDSPEDSSSLSTPSLADANRSTLITSRGELNRLEQQDLLRLASFPELSPNPIIEIDFNGVLTYINPAANLKFPRLQNDKLNHPILKGLLEQAKNTQGNLLLREIKVKEEVFEQYVHYLDESNSIRSYIFDITERKRTEQKLKYRVFHDTLTGLPNRDWFDRQLVKAIGAARTGCYEMGVIFLDLDGFKNINDSLGHSFGDMVLQAFAERVAGNLDPSALLSRWGGDEFTLLLPRLEDSDGARQVAKKIIDSLKTPFTVQGRQLYIKTSLGIAIYPRDGEDGETLLKNADAALYRAKDKGRECYQTYSSTMTSKASSLLNLETLIHKALDNNELSLYYQPQVRLKTGRIAGMEALLRWDNPELGEVAPDRLIALIERTDLNIPLCRWILTNACIQNLAWQKAGFFPLPISVNFSCRQFQHPHFSSMVIDVIEKTGLDPNFLEIEIGETTIERDEVGDDSAFIRLQALGVRFCLDDFGKGYSCLSYLQKFPFNTLKIDRSFITSLKPRGREIALVAAVLNLGHNLDLRVVVTGVETLEQLEILERLNCEEVQGFWFSRPLNSEDATRLLLQNYSS